MNAELDRLVRIVTTEPGGVSGDSISARLAAELATAEAPLRHEKGTAASDFLSALRRTRDQR